MLFEAQDIFTVQESLKDEKIAKNLDLDMGSLKEFLDLQSTDPNPRLPNRRLDRKTQKKQEIIPKKFEQTKEEKETIKTSEIISNIIMDVFNMDIGELEQQNSPEKLKLKKEYRFLDEIEQDKEKYLKMKISIGKKLELFEQEKLNTKSELKLKIQDIRIPQQKSTMNFNLKEDSTISRPNSQKLKQNNNSNSNKQFFNQNVDLDSIDSHIWLKNRFERMMKIKNQNQDIDKIWNEYWNGINISEFKTFFEYQKQHKKPIIAQELNLGDHKQIKAMIKNENDVIINIKPTSVIIIKNKQIQEEHIIFLCMQLPPLLNIIKVDLQNTNLNENSISLLNTLLYECKRLEYLNLSDNIYTKKIKQLLSQLSNLKILKLKNMKINTRQFLDLCEILVQLPLNEIDLSENNLDQYSFEAISTIIKYISTLKVLNLTNTNIFEESILPLQKRHQTWEQLEKIKKSYKRNVDVLM